MSDILWHAQEIATATLGQTTGDWSCTGISIDSRAISEGDLFIALKGPSFDGHQFVAKALESGAAGALVSERMDDLDPERLIVVSDTVGALNDLALAARARSRAKICAVTGSVGKTGVKETLAYVLSKQGRTHATQGNLNNHYGLPLTLARLPRSAEFCVLEMGMNHAGEIAPLSRMARPHVAVITTIAAAHLENFDNIEGICRAKCEIFEGLEKNGFAILNRDSAFYPMMSEAASSFHQISFGRHPLSDVCVIESQPSQNGGSLVGAEICERISSYRIDRDGDHWIVNSLCVLASVIALGANAKQAAKDFASLPGLKGRGERHALPYKDGRLHLIDESYNANEASMRAALSVLELAEGRKVAVLGDMLELGPEEIKIHESLLDALAKIDLVFACGAMMKHLYDQLPGEKQGGYAPDAQTLAPLVGAALEPGDTVCIKSSRGSRTDLVLDHLLALSQTKCDG